MLIRREFRCETCQVVFEDDVATAIRWGDAHEDPCPRGCDPGRLACIPSVVCVGTALGDFSTRPEKLRKRQKDSSRRDLTEAWESKGLPVPQRLMSACDKP